MCFLLTMELARPSPGVERMGKGHGYFGTEWYLFTPTFTKHCACSFHAHPAHLDCAVVSLVPSVSSCKMDRGLEGDLVPLSGIRMRWN